MAGVSVTSVTLSLAAQTLGPIGSGFGLWGHSQDAFVDLCSPQLPGSSTPLAPLMAPRGGSGGIVVRAGPPPPSGLSAVPGPHGLHTPVERGRPGPAGGAAGTSTALYTRHAALQGHGRASAGQRGTRPGDNANGKTLLPPQHPGPGLPPSRGLSSTPAGPVFAPKLWCASLLCERRCPGRTAQGARRRLKPTQGQVRQADVRMADSLSAEFFFQMAFGDKAVGIPEATPLRRLCPGHLLRKPRTRRPSRKPAASVGSTKAQLSFKVMFLIFLQTTSF